MAEYLGTKAVEAANSHKLQELVMEKWKKKWITWNKNFKLDHLGEVVFLFGR